MALAAIATAAQCLLSIAACSDLPIVPAFCRPTDRQLPEKTGTFNPLRALEVTPRVSVQAGRRENVVRSDDTVRPIFPRDQRE